MTRLTREADAARKRTHRATPQGRTEGRDAKRRYRENTGQGSVERPFVGVDGEGGQVKDRHEYLLLRAGKFCLETGKPLTAVECLTFLTGLPKGVVYVGYFFDYDVTMMLRDLPASKLDRLVRREDRLSRDGKYTWPVDWTDGTTGASFQFDWLPRKEFRVRTRSRLPGDCQVCDMPYDCDTFPGRCCKDCKHVHTYGRWTVVNDVGTFFQCSFVRALTEWDVGTPEQRAQIAEGKEQRASFGSVTEQEREYNALEIGLLQTLVTDFRNVCRDVGYVPSKWQGPGNMASAMLSHHGVPKRKVLADLVPADVWRFANDAYYGGRFETTAVGPVYGGVYQYDINSAYPAAMMDLPCLLHGRWELVTDGHPTERLWVGQLEFFPTGQANLYGFPVRSKQGSISFPARGSGFYWSVEAEQATHQAYSIRHAWQYVPTCDCQPFEWIQAIYDQRITLGKSTRGRVLKLCLNSLYGKQAQSIGAAPYANPIYAGLITALTRAELQRASHTGPMCCNDVYMLATDAIFTAKPRPLPLSKVLGEWDAERHNSLFLVQPGLYFADKHDQPKTRGIPRQAAVDHRTDFHDAYLNVILANYLGHTVPIELRQFTGLRIAVARGKPHTAGEWVKVIKDVSFEWSNKRDPQRTSLEPGPGDSLPTLRTSPREGGVASVPYDKNIGRLLDDLQLADQPDWADVPFGEDI